jgi:ubiquinone/menaquinone biosynthesis C-methylase UbiE
LKSLKRAKCNRGFKKKRRMMEFYNDPLKVDEYERMCDEYDGSELYNIINKHLQENSTLLELGCGPGNDIAHLQKKYAVAGSDLSDEFLLRAKKRFSNVPFLKLDAVSINTDSVFDCIFSNKVLHHFSPEDLEKSLKRQQNIIKPNGIFAHTFWLGEREFTMEGMLFVYYNREKLLDLVSRYFTILETYVYKEFEEGDSIFIVAKNDKSGLNNA